MSDAVNHPSHYTAGGIEVLDAIEAWQLNFSRGNVVKYVARAGRKQDADELEDLQKALFYLRREVKRLRQERQTEEAVLDAKILLITLRGPQPAERGEEARK
jgi:hypothetical protein